MVMKGLMAEESHSRLLSFATRGYIFKSSRPHAPEFYHCSPLGIWTDADIWRYIEKYNVPYSPLYDMTYVNRKYEGCYIKRNGCVGCCTDIAFPDNHMSVLRQTHPHLWRHYMKSGLGEQLMKPCAFDRIGERIVEDEITTSDYDSETDTEYEQLEFDFISE